MKPEGGAGSLLWLSMALVVVSNVLYHGAQKTIPRNADPAVSVLVSYAAAVALTLVLLPFVGAGKPLVASLKTLNVSSVLVGLSIVGVEFGYLLVYRAGWPLNSASLTASTAIALALVPFGILMFRESWSVSRTMGLVLCLAGLALLNRR